MDYTVAALIAVLGGLVILQALVIHWSYETFQTVKRSRDLWRAAASERTCAKCGRHA